MTRSRQFQEVVNSTSAREAPVLLLEIDHPGLSSPIRIVNDTQDLLSNANLFSAFQFRCTLPDDMESVQTRAHLAVDNVGRELTQWLEASDGGADATARIMQVLRSDLDNVEWEVTLNLRRPRLDMMEVVSELGYEDILNRPAVAIAYRPDVAPGLF